MEDYIVDPERRWNLAVRVKRGLKDTSQPGGLFKDQCYLKGAVEFLKRRKEINFSNLFAGKLTL